MFLSLTRRFFIEKILLLGSSAKVGVETSWVWLAGIGGGFQSIENDRTCSEAEGDEENEEVAAAEFLELLEFLGLSPLKRVRAVSPFSKQKDIASSSELPLILSDNSASCLEKPISWIC